MKVNIKRNLIIIFVLLTISSIFVVSYAVNNTLLDLRNQAASIPLPNYDTNFTNKCVGKISVQVSYNKQNFYDSIHLEEGYERYYLKVVDQNGKPCSTNFDVVSRICDIDNTNCPSYSSIVPWAYYASNKEGIVRADWPGEVKKGNYYAKFKPRGQNVDLSNEILVKVGGTNTSLRSTTEKARETVDLSRYFRYGIGDSYLYNSYSWIASASDPANGKVDRYGRKQTPVSGTGMIVIEEPVIWGDYKITPWRFSKDKHELYWNPRDPYVSVTQNSWTRDENLRWMVVSNGFKLNQPQAFNNFIWAAGHKSYEREAGMKGLRDLGSKWNRTYNYVSTKGVYPAYNLGPAGNVVLPKNYISGMASKYLNTEGLVTKTLDTRDDSIKSPILYNPNLTPHGGWILRIERSQPLNVSGKVYNDVVRYDFYEGDVSLVYGFNFRESYYFAKDIGLIRIDVKYFEKNDSKVGKLPCYADPDCTSDDIVNPHVRWDLVQYQPNVKMEVEVSSSKDSGYCPSNRNSICSVTINPANQTYYLRAKNSKYTGYIEARVISNPYTSETGNPTKWYWMQDGIVSVPREDIASLRKGSYKAQFRIWVPNESFVNERRLDESNTPWSNTIEVVQI